jgi:hypothetical protein
MRRLQPASSRVLELVDQRGREAGHVLLGSHPSPPNFDPARRLPPSGLAVGTVLAMVVLVAAATVFALVPDRDRTPVADGGTPATELPPLVPEYLPEGLVLSAIVDDRPEPARPDRVVTTRLYAPVSSSDPYSGPVVRLSTARQELDDDIFVGEEIDLVGRRATVHDGPGGSLVTWYQDGHAYQLSGRWVDGEAAVLLAAAVASDPADPLIGPGWQMLHETRTRDLFGGVIVFERLADAGAGWAGLNIGWSWSTDASLDLLRAGHEGVADCPERSLSACGVVVTTVRGQPALLTVGNEGPGTPMGVRLNWIEPGGRVVTVQGWGLDADEVRSVADSLRTGTWEELRAQLPLPDEEREPTVETTVPFVVDPGPSPGRDTAAAQVLVGDPRLQVRPVRSAAGDVDRTWRPGGGDPATPASNEHVRLFGPAVGGWHPGVYDLGPAVLDGESLIDAFPLAAPSNIASIRGDRLWLHFEPSVLDALVEVVARCHAQDDGCESGMLAVVWEDEVIGTISFIEGPVSIGQPHITVEVASWGMNRRSR